VQALSPIGGKIQGEVKFPCIEVTWPKVKCISIRRTRTVDLGYVNNSHVTSGVSGPKFTNFLFNAGGIAVANAVYRLSTSLSGPEIFVVKVESCRKTDAFCPPKF